MEKIEKSQYYHIYNRGIESAPIFRSSENKHHFIRLLRKHLYGKVSVLCYCLMDNHFHFAAQIISDEKSASKALSNLFNAYTKAFNKKYGRTGSLFEKNFRRKKVKGEPYLRNLIVYIHTNPTHHGMSGDYKEYPFSSFPQLMENGKPKVLLAQEFVVSLFGTKENMKIIHEIKSKHLGDLSGFQNLEKLSEAKGFPKEKFVQYIKNLQNEITSALEEIDGKAKFKEDIWEREDTSSTLSTGGGGGRTRVIENGAVFEKGGVNISEVFGKLPESMQQYLGVKDADFFACGLSLVLHPKNPFVPTVHANWRYFEMYDSKGNVVDSWFGGGQDLTPYYLFGEDAKHFHQTCKTACDKHDETYYEAYKKRCDEYFWNAHRNEARGIGGLFFDYLKETEEMKMEDRYNFVTEVGDSFLDSYLPIVEKRKDIPYSEANRNWQEIRRGRYVEFNLIHDKGTLFGLKTNGRIESILMSLPPLVQWKYDHQPEAGSEEEKLVDVLRKPRKWID